MPLCESLLFCCPCGKDREKQVRAKTTRMVLGVVADAYVAQVSQEFTSPKDVADTTFRVPLDDGATVTNFEVTVNNVVRKGVVKPKEKARNEYNAAVASGKSAQLMAQKKAQDLFEISLGNFRAGETIIVSFTYAAETSYSEGILSLHLPLFSKHRYGEVMSANQQDGGLSDVASSGGMVSIIVNSSLATGIKSLTSVNHDVNLICQGQADVPITSGRSHNLSSGQKNACVSLVLRPQQESKQDFVLKIVPSNPFVARAVLETDPTTGKKAVMVSIMPELPEAGSDDPREKEILFLCDTSGSMDDKSGDSTCMDQAKEALRIFIASLPVGVAFNIVSFATRFEFFSKTNGSRVLTSENEVELRAEAIAFVNSFEAAGGTELFPPVQAITREKPLQGRNRQVVALTDGGTGRENELMAAIAGSAGNTRWFALGLGAGASRALCEGIARNGNGTAHYSANATVLNEEVMGLLTRCLLPSAWFSVDWAAGFVPSTTPMCVDTNATTMTTSTIASGLFSAVANDVTSATSAVSRAVEPKRDPARAHVVPVPDGLFVSPEKQQLVYATLRQTSFCLVDETKGTWDAKSVNVHITLFNEEKFTFEVPLETIQGNAINALAAHAVINYLEAHDRDEAKVIEAIGMSRNIICSATSMVVVGPDQPRAATICSWKQDSSIVMEGCILSMPNTRGAPATKGSRSMAMGFSVPLSSNGGRVTYGRPVEESDRSANYGFTCSLSSSKSSYRVKYAQPIMRGEDNGSEEEEEEADDEAYDDFANPSHQLQSASPPKKAKQLSADAPLPKPKLADIIGANKSGLWTFANVKQFLPREAAVWGPEQKGSDLWVTIFILKWLQADYADETGVWSNIVKAARKAIAAKLSTGVISAADISAAEDGLQFSL